MVADYSVKKVLVLQIIGQLHIVSLILLLSSRPGEFDLVHSILEGIPSVQTRKNLYTSSSQFSVGVAQMALTSSVSQD